MTVLANSANHQDSELSWQQGDPAMPRLWQGVELPGGPRILGDPDSPRAVVLTTIELNRYAVTTGQFSAFAHETGFPVSQAQRSWIEAVHLHDHPMVHVTVEDARAFACWAAAKTGLDLRLPTTDEWEAAARYPDDRPFPWGDHPDHELCNGSDAGWGGTCSVLQYPDGANPSGIADLSGNVWEWTSTVDPETGWHDVRGGSYMDIGWGLRLARSLQTDPQRATATTGFRLCRTVT